MSRKHFKPRAHSAIWRTGLILMSTLWLTGCLATTAASSKAGDTLPPFPAPTRGVGAEINPICFPVDPKTGKRLNYCPETKEWLGRLMTYEAQVRLVH